MNQRQWWIAIVAIGLGCALWVNLRAETLFVGEEPWCATDGDIYECYYTTPRQCENAAEMAGESRWCERNPEVYHYGRPWEKYRRPGWHGDYGDT